MPGGFEHPDRTPPGGIRTHCSNPPDNVNTMSDNFHTMVNTTRYHDFHANIRKDYGDNSIKKGLSEGRITEKEADLITEYIADCKITKNHSYSRALMNQYLLVNWRRFIKKEYQECTLKDIHSGIEDLKIGKSQRGKPFAQNTIHDYVKELKPFLYWLIENEYSDLQEAKIKKIKTPPKQKTTTTPKDIFTEEEIKRIFLVCRDSKERALISILYESGGRIGEIARLKWKDLVVDKYGYGLHIWDSKTKKTRFCYLVQCAEFLSQWKRDYPGDPVNENYIFITQELKPYAYDGLARMIQRLAKKAEITKRVHTHLFRKSRITHMIQQGYQESVIKKVMWNNLNTDMFETYVILSEQDIQNELMQRAGLSEIQKQKTDILKPRPCPRCHAVNAPTSEFCPVCGEPLTEEAREAQNKNILQMYYELESDPDFKEILDEYEQFKEKAKKRMSRGYRF